MFYVTNESCGGKYICFFCNTLRSDSNTVKHLFPYTSQSLFSNKMQIPNFGINYWNSIGDRHHTSQLLILLNSINTEIETITKDVDRQKFREEMEEFINEKDKKKLTTKYRKFSQKYHPDRNINNIDNANIKFKILGNIYEFILNDNVLIL